MHLPWPLRRKQAFPLIVGPADGILTALTLAAGRIVGSDQPIDISLAIRIALATSISGGFVFFVAEYARLRGELVHAEQHLNLTSKGQLAASQLGKDVLHESIQGTVIAATGSFVGAMLPLTLGAIFPAIAEFTIVAAILVLGVLGIIVSQMTQGNSIYWAVALMVVGVLLSMAGAWLSIT